MKLIITRHGESEENSSGILQGLLPGKLNEIGIQQSEKLGQRLIKEKIDIVYCSPINRCLETLEHIRKHIDLSIPVVISGLLRERDFGQFSGKAQSEINYDEIDKNTEKNRALGVESLDQVSIRTKQFLDEIKNKHPDQTVLVISHSNPLRMAFAHLLNKTFSEILEKYKIKNASVSIFEVGDIVTPIVVNQTDFLQ